MSLPVVTAENYYSPEMNMAYMGSTQFKAFEKCEAAALAELKGEYHPLPPRPFWSAATLTHGFPGSCLFIRHSTRRSSSGTVH